MRVGIRSPGILRIPRLEALLEAEVVPLGRWASVPRLEAYAGWGRRPSGLWAEAAAARHGGASLCLEDAFLRSPGLGGRRNPPWGLVVDDLGIYYDAARPSRLEALIAAHGQLGAAELDEARSLIAAMRFDYLGKYNADPDLLDDDTIGRDRPLVLVVDQTEGDASIPGGLASAASFAAMLEAALAENPDAEVAVRVHPDVVAGKRRGYLLEEARRHGLRLIDQRVSWLSLAERARRVYVVTSHAGLEALIAGVPVTCFGMPHYAGWGLTDDRMACPRRTARPTLEALVAAAYGRYCRFVDPIHGRRVGPLAIAERLAAVRRQDRAWWGTTHLTGLPPWRVRFVAPYLASRQGRLRYHRRPDAALRAQALEGGQIAIWSSREPPGFAEAAAAQKAPVVRIEDGFLRSVGLGSNHVAPGSLILDGEGVYYDPRRPSVVETLLQSGAVWAYLERAARLREALVARGLTKYNLTAPAPELPPTPGRRRILVPGQVEDDASIRFGTSPPVTGNLALLQAVRAAAPDAFVIYKPHPDVEAGNRVGKVPEAQVLQHADLLLRDAAADRLLAAVDEVHTMTSLLGFEALLRGRRVVTYGAPFYAGWGLTEDRLTFPRRTRRPMLDELVAVALILAPSYHDPATGLPCGPEDLVERLAATGRPAAARLPLGQLGRGWRLIADWLLPGR